MGLGHGTGIFNRCPAEYNRQQESELPHGTADPGGWLVCDAGRVSKSYLDLKEFMILSIWEVTMILLPLGFQVRWSLFDGSFSLRSVLRVAG